jgi:hypothetical protein
LDSSVTSAKSSLIGRLDVFVAAFRVTAEAAAKASLCGVNHRRASGPSFGWPLAISIMSFASEVATAGVAGLARDVDARAERPRGLREALLSTAAAGALSLALGGPALAGPDACTTAGAVVTCSGNQSDGITNFGGTLNVNNLTQAIAPASGTPGIYSFSLSDVTIVSDTGAFGITTVGDGANGIYAYSSPFAFFYAYPVTVTSTGNITTAGNEADGIYAVARSFGPVTVTSTGNIVTTGSEAHGIYALTIGGAITVTSSGNITTAGSDAVGIWAQGGGAIAVAINSSTVSGG